LPTGCSSFVEKTRPAVLTEYLCTTPDLSGELEPEKWALRKVGILTSPLDVISLKRGKP